MRTNLLALAGVMALKSVVAFFSYVTTGDNMWAMFAVTDSVLSLVTLSLYDYVKGK